MIVKIGKGGTSFKGLAQYLTHDPDAETSNRVSWTKTLNLANDFVPAAVSEMLWTHRDAEILKREAGVRAGGRKNEKSVKHISLSWDPRDNPSDQHMIATTEHFLKRNGWEGHQAIIVCHDDRAFRHVHVMLNRVHPETGRTHRDGNEQERAQRWADAYERENGIRCPQRELHPYGREKSMPRNMHMAFKNCELEFEKSEQRLREFHFPVENRQRNEWKIFKEIQRSQRDQFYAEGKIKFRQMRDSVYYTVHEKFRERWSDYYKADRKTKGDDRRFLKDVKSQLITDEKAALTVQRDAAFAELMTKRRREKELLLAGQRADRAEFRDRLKTGQDNAEFFRRLSDKGLSAKDLHASLNAAKREITAKLPQAAVLAGKKDVAPTFRKAPRMMTREKDIASRGMAKAGRVGRGILGALLDSLVNLGSAKPEPAPRVSKTFERAAEEATRQHREQVQQQNDEKWSRDRHVYRE